MEQIKQRCSTCEKFKIFDDFCRSRNAKNGRHNECRLCHRERSQKKYYSDVNKSRKKKRDLVYKWRTENPEKLLLAHTRQRARRNDIPFNLTIDDIKIPEFCPVLGIRLRTGQSRINGKLPDNVPSLDRINPTKGYTKGNVAVISWRANHLKNNATEEELASILDYMRRMKKV